MDSARVEDRPALSLERFYPVAPEKVWRAWTDPQALSRWFGPGAPQPVARAELDVRVGGRYRIVFGGATGEDHEVQGEYRVVEPNRRLVFTWCWPRTTPERESLVTVTLRAERGGTAFVFLHERFADVAARNGHLGGWTESFLKLERSLLD